MSSQRAEAAQLLNMELANIQDAVTQLNIRGPTLAFHNVHYSVSVPPMVPFKGGKEKEVLRDVSGIMKPGMNAILGPTGSGKTSLLDVLAGWKDPKGLKSGQIFMDGKLVDSNIHRCSAYVVQEDILTGTLSVRENLQFSANLRLPQSKHSSAEKAAKVDAVIQELGLQDCADTKIGTEFLRGVSGGEKKRCSIGMELITSPSLIFLDEPTTGLDANTANAIMQLLHQLSRKGRTVIFSIHQPRYSIFRLLDHLTLMNKGEIIFAGPAREATAYFNSIGYQCEQFNNPLDFFLDVISGEVIQSQTKEDFGSKSSFSSSSSLDKSPLSRYYLQSSFYQELQEELKSLRSSENHPYEVTLSKATYVTSFIHQLYVVSCRNVKQLLRNPQTSFGQILLGAIFSVLVGLIYYQIPDTMPEALQNRLGAFFFTVLTQIFGNLSAVELFIYDRKLFIHESARNYYRTSAYFLAKVFADLLPNRIFPVLLFSSISYFMMGLKPDAIAFFLYVLSLSLTNLAAVSLAFLVSASVNSFAVANLLIALPYVFMMVFGGFLVNLNSMLNWLSWIKWISIYRYGMNALTINELTGLTFHLNSTRILGEMYMEQQEIDYSTWGFWENHLALLCLTSVFLFFAYIQLLRVNRWK
ncbi:broad substrate specificity ATP-binding cassette transporter ABCG2-like isoform X2 [Varanus komodoensis]|uniref:broad substrate specificity ATP-binding cassette transporter ABCG2-like isoform X2 n=1 Tax=Varanus komodoensis TaxID=61221 RepID=UPI001CF77368|nr:broad substrate specificity ATP-binding cassette transporter ABCG2-like isoform X2 [Varanus komodoensis]